MDISSFGLLHEVLDLFDVSISFFFEALDVDGDDDMKVGDGTSHFSDFFEYNMVALGRGYGGK
jgi:hypothetical protein